MLFRSKRNSIKPYIIGFGFASLAIAGAFVATKFFRSRLTSEISRLRLKIKAGWVGNEGLAQIKIKSEMNFQFQSMKYQIKLLEAKKFIPPPQIPDAKFDPFARENYGSFFISDLSEEHTLLIEVEILTKKIQKTAIDFTQCLKVMDALEGFVYFNSGPKSGASQRHKHIQGIPYSSFPISKMPIESLIKNRKGEYYCLDEFKFKHIFYGFDNDIIKTIENKNYHESAVLIERIYKECLRKLNNESLTIEYNMLLTNHWIFLVSRSKESVMDKIKINAMAFTGSFIVST